MSGYQYLGSVYSKFPGGIHAAFEDICLIAARFIKAGIPIFCPIAHSHPIAIEGCINPFAHDIWLPADKPLMEAASGLIVVMMQGWRESVGLAHEIAYFEAAGKPIRYFDPDKDTP